MTRASVTVDGIPRQNSTVQSRKPDVLSTMQAVHYCLEDIFNKSTQSQIILRVKTRFLHSSTFIEVQKSKLLDLKGLKKSDRGPTHQRDQQKACHYITRASYLKQGPHTNVTCPTQNVIPRTRCIITYPTLMGETKDDASGGRLPLWRFLVS